jgi:hypothetical protein
MFRLATLRLFRSRSTLATNNLALAGMLARQASDGFNPVEGYVSNPFRADPAPFDIRFFCCD